MQHNNLLAGLLEIKKVKTEKQIQDRQKWLSARFSQRQWSQDLTEDILGEITHTI